MITLLRLLFLLLHVRWTVSDKLKLSILIFRHGDRSPISDIPNDIYNTTDSWPQGPGQLSTIGTENHLKNGQFFKARYTDPSAETYLGLNPEYKRVEVYVRSTDRDRTLMSAQSFLSGLFPPITENNLTSPLDVWQPIPVHTIPIATEKMLDGPPQPCPVFEESYRETVLNNEEFVSFMHNNTETSQRIIALCGWAETTDLYSTLDHIETTYDTLFCEASHNYEMKKEFADADLLNLVTPYNNVRWGLYNVMTDEEKAFTGGVLLRELKERVRAAIEKQNEHKLVIFSAHDTTLASILTCLGVYDGVQTPYATVVMVEVWEKDDNSGGGGHVIRLHRHHKDEDLISYTMPGCDESGCSEEQFYSLNNHMEISEADILDRCSKDWPDFVPGLGKNILFVMLCATILVTVSTLFVTTIYLFNFKRKAVYLGLAASDQKQSLLGEEDYQA